MPFSFLARIPAVLVLAGLLATVSAGQARPASNRTGAAPFQDPTASISGTLVDSLGQAVSAAKVTVTSAELGIERRSQTDDQGYFYIPFLQPGTYTLLIEMSGFGTIRVSDLALQSGMASALSLTLNPRGAKEVIDVKASPSAIDAGSATIKYTIPNKQVETLPIIATTAGRSILESLPLFLPGISPAFYLGIRGEGLVANGARPLSNSFSIEGGDDNDYELNRAAAPLPNPDALQEVTVATNNYKADVGGAAGAVIDATVKPGTNRFHGNLRYFVQDPALAASGFFHVSGDPNRLSSFGGQIGGPVLIPGLYNGRDRTHFFFDFEDNYTGQGYDSWETTLSVADRSGNFGNVPGYDPNSNHPPIDPLTGRPFPGGIIPQDRISLIARYYMDNVIPVPDHGSFYSYRANSVIASRNKQYTTRVDHLLGERDTLTGVVFVNLNDYSSSLSGGQRFRRWNDITHSLNVVVHETHTFTATWVNQVTATFVRFPEGTSLDEPGLTGVQPSQVGFTGFREQNNGPAALPQLDFFFNHYFGTLTWNATMAAGEAPGGGTTKTTIALKDDLIRAAGKHIVKGGAGTRFFIMDRLEDPPNGPAVAPRNGAFGFGNLNPYGTGTPIADFLLGLPSVYAQSTGVVQHLRQRPFSFYVMDDWRVRPDLTLNLGLRYDFTPPLTDQHNLAMVFRPGAHSSVLPYAPEGLLFTGDKDPILGQVPRTGYRGSWTDFAPRLGVAFSPRARRGLLHALFGEGKSSIRAGFGMFYNPTYGFDSSKSLGGPFSESLFFEVGKHGSFANPFGRQPNPFPVLTSQTLFDYSFNVDTFDPRFRTAYTYQYNLSMQRELPGSLLLDLQYVGSSSFRLDREFDDNPYFLNPTRSHPVPTYLQLGHIYVQKSDGGAKYDSFQARLSRKFKAGLMLDMSYVFSKSLDNSSGPLFEKSLGPSFSNDLAGFSDPYAWGRSEFDRRHTFAAFYAYDLPEYKGARVIRLFLNRWQIGGITQLRAGMPLDLQGPSLNGRPDVVARFRRLDPRRISTFVIDDGAPVRGNFLFDPTAFSNVDPNSPSGLGNLGRNVFSGPGLNLTSLSIVKRSKVADSQEIDLRADITNVFNHTNFRPDQVVTNKANLLFGQVYGALPARNIQLSVRYKF